MKAIFRYRAANGQLHRGSSVIFRWIMRKWHMLNHTAEAGPYRYWISKPTDEQREAETWPE